MADDGGGEAPRERPSARDRRHGGRSRGKSARSTEEPNPSAPVTEDPASGPAPESKAAEKAPAVPLHWREAAWFASGHGDLWFAQWLLGRCQGLGDITTPSKADIVERVFRLHLLQKQLRAELAAGSPSASPKASAEPWSMQAVVRDVLAELRPQPEEPRSRGACERAMVSELMELTTEVLLCHADVGDLDALKDWVEWLSRDSSPAEEDEPQQSDHISDGTPQPEEQEATEAEGTKVKKPRRKKERATPESLAAKQVAEFMAFLTAKHDDTNTCLDTVSDPAEAHALWQQEVKSIFDELKIDLQEETRRLGVVNQLQQIIRRDGRRWKNVQLSLFGSSLSRYGSKSSDVDMCLIFPTSSDDEPTKQLTVSARQLKAMSKPSVIAQDHANDAALLLELRGQVLKSKQKVTLMAEEMKQAKAKNPHKQAKQLNALNFFAGNLSLLYDAISAKLGDDGKHEHSDDNHHDTVKPNEEFKALLAQSKRRSDDLYRLRALLQRAKCDIRYVLSGARIPIIRFMHTPSGMDCDLCFDNVLATRNTRLLRAYATLDDRARILGMAVKYWAKQRAVSDASLGYLSSYSFVLLTIYFLQRVAHILPNLQHPQLLVDANIRPDYQDEIDIAFCTDLTMARSFHLANGGSEDASLNISSLLLGFFKFYATCFDFAHHVVTIRHPELEQMEKRSRWGRDKAKSWRISIEDPLETTRDLGCVLQFKAQQQIFDEFQRAYELLAGGESFSSCVCEPVKSAGKASDKSAKPRPKEKAARADKSKSKPQRERKRAPKQDARPSRDRASPDTDAAPPGNGVSIDADTSETPKPSENGEQSTARSKRPRDSKRGKRGNEHPHEPKEAPNASRESKATTGNSKAPASKGKRIDSKAKKENAGDSRRKRENKSQQQKPGDAITQDSPPPAPVAP